MDAASVGMADLPIITVPLPRGGVGSIEPDVARQKANEVFEELIGFLTVPVSELSRRRQQYLGKYSEAKVALEVCATCGVAPPAPEEIEIFENSLNGVLELNRLWTERDWTDGHPVYPPTRQRVNELVQATGREPEDVLAVLPPRFGIATVAKVATNSAMAGCGPEHMPIVLAAVEALAEKDFLLAGVQKTTHDLSPLVLVNGPIRHQVGISCGEPGTSWRGNAAIGRAIRLVAMNVSDVPGRANVCTHGWLAKYMYCVAENEERSPWEPLHVERGFRAADSAVTLFAAEPPHVIDDQASTSAQAVLTNIAGTMASVGSEDFINRAEPLLMLGPEHAMRIGKGNFSKEDVKYFLFEHARVPLYMVPEEYQRLFSVKMQKMYTKVSNHARIPMADRPEDFVVTVVGGLGQHSLWIANMSGSRSVTKLIRTRSE